MKQNARILTIHKFNNFGLHNLRCFKIMQETIYSAELYIKFCFKIDP